MANIDWNLVLNFIFRILLILFTAFVIPAIKRYLDKKYEEEDTQALIDLIYELVRAAEQLLYDKDEDGSLRKQYVMEQLINLGYEWDNKINAYVESAVYDLNCEAHPIKGSRTDDKKHMDIFLENVKKEKKEKNEWYESFAKEAELDDTSSDE